MPAPVVGLAASILAPLAISELALAGVRGAGQFLQSWDEGTPADYAGDFLVGFGNSGIAGALGGLDALYGAPEPIDNAAGTAGEIVGFLVPTTWLGKGIKAIPAVAKGLKWAERLPKVVQRAIRSAPTAIEFGAGFVNMDDAGQPVIPPGPSAPAPRAIHAMPARMPGAPIQIDGISDAYRRLMAFPGVAEDATTQGDVYEALMRDW